MRAYCFRCGTTRNYLSYAAFHGRTQSPRFQCGLGRRTLEEQYHPMKRLCSLSVLIAFLAAMVMGPSVLARPATGSMAYVGPAVESFSPPRHSRRDCSKAPCASPVGCIAPCATATSILIAPPIGLPLVAVGNQDWVLDLTMLVGCRPAPDPFPPKI